MNTNLIVDDPLAGQDVSIIITLTAGEDDTPCPPRDERPSLVSVGVAGQLPITRSGLFGEAADLIDAAWTAFGVQAQLAAQTKTTAVSATGGGEELIAETAVGDSAKEAALPPLPATVKPTAPKPTASNLSLF